MQKTLRIKTGWRPRSTRLAAWNVTIEIDDWLAVYLFTPDGRYLRLVGCRELRSKRGLAAEPNAAVWRDAESESNRWRARDALYYQATPVASPEAGPRSAEGFWWMYFDDIISHPERPPRRRGRGRPATSTRDLARVALSHERVKANLDGDPGDLARRRAEDLNRDIELASKQTTKARKLGLLDGDVATERARWLAELDAFAVPAAQAEAIMLSTEASQELAVEHGFSVEQVEGILIGRGARPRTPRHEGDDIIAKALELLPDTVRRIRAGEAGERRLPVAGRQPATDGTRGQTLEPTALHVARARR